MAKAYDRVEWCYLRAVMLKMEFASGWVNRIMQCVESTIRGIRQGDLISPYLFLLCSEGLSAMLKYNGQAVGGMAPGRPKAWQGCPIYLIRYRIKG
jgi:hypothetical protein